MDWKLCFLLKNDWQKTSGSNKTSARGPDTAAISETGSNKDKRQGPSPIVPESTLRSELELEIYPTICLLKFSRTWSIRSFWCAYIIPIGLILYNLTSAKYWLGPTKGAAGAAWPLPTWSDAQFARSTSLPPHTYWPPIPVSCPICKAHTIHDLKMKFFLKCEQGNKLVSPFHRETERKSRPTAMLVKVSQSTSSHKSFARSTSHPPGLS